MTKHWPKPTWEERVYFSLHLSGHSQSPRDIRAGTQGRRLEAGTGKESKEECCHLACSLSHTQLPLLHRQNRCPWVVPLQWAGSYYISHESRKRPRVNLMESFSQQRSLFLDDPSLCQVSTKLNKSAHISGRSSTSGKAIKALLQLILTWGKLIQEPAPLLPYQWIFKSMYFWENEECRCLYWGYTDLLDGNRTTHRWILASIQVRYS